MNSKRECWRLVNWINNNLLVRDSMFYWGGYSPGFDLWFIFYLSLTVSMIMFSTFEHSVNFIYQNIIQRRKEDCSRTQQLGVTCLAGYTAGAFGTFVSNPADNIVSSLYNKKADNVLQVGSLSKFLTNMPKHTEKIKS